MPTGSHAVRNQEKILWNKKDVNPNWGLQSHQIPLNHSRNWWDRWAQHLSKHFQIELAVFNKKHIRTFGVKPWKKDHLTYHWTSARIPPIPGNLTSCFKVKVLWKENVLCIFLCTYIQLYIYIYIYTAVELTSRIPKLIWNSSDFHGAPDSDSILNKISLTILNPI